MEHATRSQETSFHAQSAWGHILAQPLVLGAAWTLAIRDGHNPWLFVLAGLISLIFAVCLFGYTIVTPNHSKVLVLFGRYRGTLRREGFYWMNPFTWRHSVSLRAHNVASEKIKVNDLLGNPIEIGAVIVWRVRDTAQASFDVEDHEKYVDVQVETAIREIAKTHPYDDGQTEENLISLRGDTSAVVEALKKELQARLDRAGIEVLETRSATLPTHPRSPRPCCSASRPRPSSPRGRRSWKAP